MQPLHLSYAVVGLLALAVALGSTAIRRLPITSPLLALVAGVIVGPQLLRWVDLPAEQRPVLILEVSRVLLAISLMAVALRYPVRGLLPLRRPLLLLLVLVMPGMAAITGALAWLTLGIPLALAALLGACVSPTDPVLASSVVTGGPAEETVSARTRRLLSIESGANDGLAYPLVVIAMGWFTGASLAGSAWHGGWAVGAAVVLGAAIGAAMGKVVVFAHRRGDVDSGSLLVFTLVLAIATLGAARLIDADGVLAVFVAGLAYNWQADPHDREQEALLDEALNRYLVLPLFLLLGIELPWQQWSALGWGAVAFALLVLLLRRLPLLLVLRVPLRLHWRDACFLGWFGPVGVSALFYLAHAEEHGAGDPRLWALGTLVVAVSTVAHGISASPARALYGRAARASTTPDDTVHASRER